MITIRESTVLTDQNVTATTLGMIYHTDIIKVDSNMFSGCEVVIQEFKTMGLRVWYTGSMEIGDTPDKLDQDAMSNRPIRTSSSFYLRLSCRPVTYDTTYIVSANIREIDAGHVSPINITWYITVGPDPRDKPNTPTVSAIPPFAFLPTTGVPGETVTSDVITLTGLPTNTTYTVSTSGERINLGLTAANPGTSSSATVTTGSTGPCQIMFSVTQPVLVDQPTQVVTATVSDGTHAIQESWVINSFTYSASAGLKFDDLNNVWTGETNIVSNIVHVTGLPKKVSVQVGTSRGTVAASSTPVTSFSASDFFRSNPVVTSANGDLYVQAKADGLDISGLTTVTVGIFDNQRSSSFPNRYIYWEIRSTVSQVYTTTTPTTIATSKKLEQIPESWCLVDQFNNPWSTFFSAIYNPADSKLYLVGGTKWENKCYRYDFNTAQWEYAGDLHNRRNRAIIGIAANGELVVVGGNSLTFLENANTIERINGPGIVYNYGLDSSMKQVAATVYWNQVSRNLPFTIFVPRDMGTIYGGICYVMKAGTCELNAIDLETANDRGLPNFRSTVARYSGALAGLNNRIYAIGGGDYSMNPLNSVEYYELSTNKWHTGPSLNTARHNFATIAANNIYVFGGIGANGTELDSIEMFDGTKWTTLSQKLPKPGGNVIIANVGTTVYIFYNGDFKVYSVVIPSINAGSGFSYDPTFTPSTVVPITFTIPPKFDEPKDSDILSDVITVTGVYTPKVTISIVAGDGFVKFGKNTTELANAQWVKTGDATCDVIHQTTLLQLKIKSSNVDHGTVLTTVKVGSYQTNWTVITSSAGGTSVNKNTFQLTNFKFENIIGVPANNYVISNMITINGLTTGTEVKVYASRGEIAIGETTPNTNFDTQQTLTTTGSFVVKAKLMAGSAGQTENTVITIEVGANRYTTKWTVTSILEEFPPMEIARTGSQMIYFYDHLLYVLGGHNGNEEAIAEIEAYNFNTKSWSTVGKMAIPRWDFSVKSNRNAYNDSREIYSVGGYKEKNVLAPNAEYYYPGLPTSGQYDGVTNPPTGSGIKLISGGMFSGGMIIYGIDSIVWGTSLVPLPTDLHNCNGFTITSLLSTEYIIGGNDARNQVLGKIYKRGGIDGLSWQVVSSLETPRTNHTVLKFNGKLYVIGGTNQNGELVSSIELFDGLSCKHIATLDSTLLGGVMINLGDVVYVTMPNDPVIKTFSLWGLNNEKNTKSVGTATSPAPLNYPRYDFGCVKDKAGNIYVVGGSLSFYDTTTSVEKYNVTTNTWTLLPSFTIPRTRPTIVIDNNDKIYVIGGYYGSDTTFGYVTKVEVYDIASGRWSYLPQYLDLNIFDLNVFYLTYRKKTNDLFILGNLHDKGTIFQFNLTTGNFTQEYEDPISKFPQASSVIIEASDTIPNGSIFIVGGIIGGMYSYRYARLYNFSDKSLTNLKPLRKSRMGPTICDNNGTIYVFGGGSTSTGDEPDNGTGEYFDRDKNDWIMFNGPDIGFGNPQNTYLDSKKNLYLYNDSSSRIIDTNAAGDYIYSDSVIFTLSSTGTWGTIYLTSPRMQTGVIEVPGDYIYVIGGLRVKQNVSRSATNRNFDFIYEPINAVERFKIGSNVIQSSTTITNLNTGTTQPANSVIPAPPPLNTSRYDFGFTQLSNNLIYIIGGKGESDTELSSVECYDLLKNTWTTVAPLSKPRTGGKAVVDKNNNIYIIGGTTIGSTSTSIKYVLDVERFSNNKWEVVTQLPLPRANHEVQINLTTNEIYVFGGAYNYTDKYSINTNTWSQLPFARDNSVGSTIDNDGNIYYFSSETDSDDISFYKFNIVTNKWDLLNKSEELPYTKFTSVMTKTNKEFVIGGLSKKTSITASTKWFNTTTKTWTAAPDIPSGVRSYHSSVADSNNKIFVIGGGVHRQLTIGNYGNKLIDAVDVLDSVALTWTTVSKLNNPRFGAQSVIFNNNTIFNFGGWTANGKASAIVERYDPTTNKWYTSTVYSTTVSTTGNTTTSNTTSNTTTTGTTTKVTFPVPDLTAPTVTVNPNITPTTTTPDKQSTTKPTVVINTTGYPAGTTVSLPSTVTPIINDKTIVNVPVIVDQSATWGVNQSTSLTNTIDIKIKAFYGLSEFTALNLK